MCGRKLKAFLLSLVLVFLSCSRLVYAEVTLTDEEATELQTLIQESQKELRLLKTELTDVQTNLQEQKKSYEQQLNVAKRNNYIMKAVTIVSILFAGYMAIK